MCDIEGQARLRTWAGVSRAKFSDIGPERPTCWLRSAARACPRLQDWCTVVCAVVA